MTNESKNEKTPIIKTEIKINLNVLKKNCIKDIYGE